MAGLTFTDVEVRAFDLDHLDLYWTLGDTTEDPARWAFSILRSVDGAAGPFEVIADAFINDGQFRDSEVNRLHNWREYFYKLRATNKDDARVVEAGPVYLQAPPDLYGMEFRRRFELMLKEFNGRKVLIYPAITSGFRCRNCYDMNDRGYSIGRQTNQNCATCYDTSFAGGFGKPIVSWLQFDPSRKDVQRTDTTEMDREDSTARLSFFPPLKPKDMIVEAENVRWEVQSVAMTKKLRSTVHQEIEIHRIPSSDVRYRALVDADALSNAGPAREFTRPMNLLTAQGEEHSPLADLLDNLMGGD